MHRHRNSKLLIVRGLYSAAFALRSSRSGKRCGHGVAEAAILQFGIGRRCSARPARAAHLDGFALGTPRVYGSCPKPSRTRDRSLLSWPQLAQFGSFDPANAALPPMGRSTRRQVEISGGRAGELKRDLIYAALSGQLLSRFGDGYEQNNDF